MKDHSSLHRPLISRPIVELDERRDGHWENERSELLTLYLTVGMYFLTRYKLSITGTSLQSHLIVDD